MSLEVVLTELRLLRRDLAELGARVTALEVDRAGTSSGAGSITVSYLGAPAASEEEPVVAAEASVPAPKAGARQYSEQERIEAAEKAGQFLKRALSGGLLGTSSRDQLNIQSRVYVLCRDIHGKCYNPPQVHRAFSTLKPLVKNSEGLLGDSVFIGLPTLWEAKIAVRAAGLEWSASLDD